MKRSLDFPYDMDTLARRVPMIGDILAISPEARFSLALATTFEAGVPLIEALDAYPLQPFMRLVLRSDLRLRRYPSADAPWATIQANGHIASTGCPRPRGIQMAIAPVANRLC